MATNSNQTPTHIVFPTTDGHLNNALVLGVEANGYRVSAFGGQHMSIPFGLVCYPGVIATR